MKTNIKPFFKAISDILHKNYGGCLFFAYAFYKWLLHNGYSIESFEIHQIGCNSEIETNLQFIKGEHKCATSSYHFIWKYEGVFYDSDGLYDGALGNNYTHLPLFPNSIDNFCVSALTQGEWNPLFRRNAAIDLMADRLSLDFEHVRD